MTGNVEVTVYLTDPVNPDIVAELTDTLQQLPAVDTVEFESKEEAYQRFKELFANQPAVVENADPDAIPASLRVKLADTSQYAQVTEALGCTTDAATGVTACVAPGVRKVNDFRELLDRLSTITRRAVVRDRVRRARDAGVGRRPGREHAADGDVRATQGDRDHAAGGGHELAHPRAVPDRGVGRSA